MTNKINHESQITTDQTDPLEGTNLHIGIVKMIAEQNHELLPSQIQELSSQVLYELIEQLNDPDQIKRVAVTRFLGEAQLKNQDLENPYIEWLPMNREPESWLALALAKVIKFELNVHPDDLLLMIPSSGLWLKQEFVNIFPENFYPILKKEKELLESDVIFTSIPVRSHSNNRQPKEIFICSNPNSFSGKRVIIIDDVIARGDATLDIMWLLDSFGVTSYCVAVVMDKVLQSGSKKLQSEPNSRVDGYQALVSVEKVTQSPNEEKYEFILS